MFCFIYAYFDDVIKTKNSKKASLRRSSAYLDGCSFGGSTTPKTRKNRLSLSRVLTRSRPCLNSHPLLNLGHRQIYREQQVDKTAADLLPVNSILFRGEQQERHRTQCRPQVVCHEPVNPLPLVQDIVLTEISSRLNRDLWNCEPFPHQYLSFLDTQVSIGDTHSSRNLNEMILLANTLFQSEFTVTITVSNTCQCRHSDTQPKRSLGNWNAPRDLRDLYTPRYTKGSGNKKIALCPICYEEPTRGGEGRQEWNHTKTSQHKWVPGFLVPWTLLTLLTSYHMQYYHGNDGAHQRLTIAHACHRYQRQ